MCLTRFGMSLLVGMTDKWTKKVIPHTLLGLLMIMAKFGAF